MAWNERASPYSLVLARVGEAKPVSAPDRAPSSQYRPPTGLASAWRGCPPDRARGGSAGTVPRGSCPRSWSDRDRDGSTQGRRASGAASPCARGRSRRQAACEGERDRRAEVDGASGAPCPARSATRRGWIGGRRSSPRPTTTRAARRPPHGSGATPSPRAAARSARTRPSPARSARDGSVRSSRSGRRSAGTGGWA